MLSLNRLTLNVSLSLHICVKCMQDTKHQNDADDSRLFYRLALEFCSMLFAIEVCEAKPKPHVGQQVWSSSFCEQYCYNLYVWHSRKTVRNIIHVYSKYMALLMWRTIKNAVFERFELGLNLFLHIEFEPNEDNWINLSYYLKNYLFAWCNETYIWKWNFLW